MKKVISMIVAGALVAVLAVSLAACNNDTPTNVDEPGTSEKVVAEVEGSTAA